MVTYRGYQYQRQNIITTKQHRNQSNHPGRGESIFNPTETIDATTQITKVTSKADQY